ncbi:MULTISPECIES: hypothetical protein [Inquilinus]|jgi:hypothetical protein|uniref:Uncharacterized protein n=2 Tax=Inquilinus limosus TaxID=171674 RepID=A0A211YZ68_9PROT|nr:hypothetical protein [Inquilinus limosus]KGM30540.1 hypothetical protein P409_32400 [Inquilinus limosus MP06]OWJ58306.1 hypothetical protein BWR60_33465 [Inquilinus limosus]
MADAFIIVAGGLTAGIVTREPRGFRFYASDSAFTPLEGRLFRTTRAAGRAAHAALTTIARRQHRPEQARA